MIAEPVYKLSTLFDSEERHIVFLGFLLLNSNRYRNFFHGLVMIVLNGKLNEQADDWDCISYNCICTIILKNEATTLADKNKNTIFATQTINKTTTLWKELGDGLAKTTR